MNKEKLNIIALLVSFLLVGSAVVYAQAQESNIPQGPTDAQVQASGITFPVPELGNCGSKGECKKYCESPSNVEACVAFAEKHGLMNKEEAAQAKKFTQALAKGGPGGCKSAQECESFCSNVANLEACMSFAKKQGIKNDQVNQGEKLLAHMKAGGKTPGGCTSEADCRSYCGDFSHAEECYEFAKKAGIGQSKGQVREGGPRGPGKPGPRGEDDISPEQFKKFIELAKSGQTPGGCKSKEVCEQYCDEEGHMEECVAFGEKIGFVSSEEAAMIRKNGGKGPGGCSSPQACQSFCDNPSHREECFKFAEENGLIGKEEVQRMKEGLVQMRAGIEHAPPEVAACLKSTLGSNVLDDIQAGKLTPGPEIGDRMRDCFEKFGHRGGPQDVFKNAPPEVAACIKEKIGDKFEAIKSGKEAPTPEMADTLRVCFQSVQFEHDFGGEGGEGFGPGPGNEQGEGGPRGPGIMRQGPPAQALQQFLRTAPPQVQECLKQKLGDNFAKVQSNEPVEGFDPSIIRNCFESFRPQEHFGPPEGEGGGQGGFPGGPRGGIPEDVLACVKEKSGGAVDVEKLRRGERPTPEVEKVMGECFGKMGPQGGQSFFGGFGGGPGSGVPEDVFLCAKEKLSTQDIEKLRSGGERSPEAEKVLSECFGKMRPDRQYGGVPGEQGGKGGPFPQGPGQAFGQGGIPHEVLSCVKEKVGGDMTEEKLRASTGDQRNLGQAIRECFGKMQPPGQGRPENQPRSGPGGNQGGLPESVLSCVKEKAGDTVDIEKLRRGDRPAPEVEKVIAQCFPQRPQEGEQNREGKGMMEGQPFPADRMNFASGTPGEFRGGDRNFPPQPGTGERPQFNPFGPNGQGPQQFGSGTPARFDGQQQFSEQYKQEFNRQVDQQYNAEFQKQYEEKFRNEVNRQTQGFPGGQGGFPGQPNQPGQYPKPPEGGMAPGQEGKPGYGNPFGGGPGPQGEQHFGPNQPNQQFGPGPNQPFQPQQPGPAQQMQPNQPNQPAQPFQREQPSGGTPPPPPSGEQQPPPPPSSAVSRPSLLGVILAPFMDLIGR
ncbi:MAG: hypothetical protein HYY10_00280 [Candidatus Liptonbacteria bacterium]|nr:hypothetical protein [Candidatus Liptonbacteria bacterium]